MRLEPGQQADDWQARGHGGGLVSWFEAHDSAGHAITGTGPPRSAVFPAAPSSPRSPFAAQQRPPVPSSPLSELHSVSEDRCADGATFTLAALMTTFLARTSVPLSSSPAQHPASGAAVSSEKVGTFHVNRDHRGHRCGRHRGRSPGDRRDGCLLYTYPRP